MKYDIVSLCDRSGILCEPWAEAGLHCLCIDIEHPIRNDRVKKVGDGSITFRYGDVRSLTLNDIGKPLLIAAFPPCTDLTVAGARDFERKGLRALIDALILVEACRILCENSGARYFIENPVGRLNTLWRKPDFTFDPCDFGDPYTKMTCLWIGNGIKLPIKKRVRPTESYITGLTDDIHREYLRSLTPKGFARALFEANKDLCEHKESLP